MNLSWLFKYPNVVGFSRELKPKIVNGKETEIESVRVYVEKKLPESELKKTDIIPKEVAGIPTDIIEVGKIEALILMTVERSKTDRIRPLEAGISIGNWNITAGTLGWYFEDNKGNIYFGSNAHVFCENPTKEKQNEVRIVQPGRYDGGKLPDDLVARLYWYQRVYLEYQQSNCKVAKAVAGIYNSLAKLFGARTRLIPIVSEYNYIDFAVTKPVKGIEYSITAFDFIPSGEFVGLAFAGSPKVSCICKAKYIVETGYRPVEAEVVEVTEGVIVEKSGRTTCHTRAKVIDASAVVRVWYGNGFAVFDDIILTEKMLEGGDSGSSVWVVVE